MNFTYNSTFHLSNVIKKNLEKNKLIINEYAEDQIFEVSLRCFYLQKNKENLWNFQKHKTHLPCNLISWISRSKKYSSVFDFLTESQNIVDEFELFAAVNSGEGHEILIRKSLNQSLFDVSFGSPFSIELIEKIFKITSIGEDQFPNIYKGDQQSMLQNEFLIERKKLLRMQLNT